MKTRAPKKLPRDAMAGAAELVFVVDVSSLTNDGFVGSSSYDGKEVDLRFDDSGEGVFLTPQMVGRLQVRKGSKVTLFLEDESILVVELTVAGVEGSPRISDPKVYYAVGHEGGAVLRLRKA